MKAPMSWLKNFVDIDVTSKEYADALTLSGSKVEAIEVLGEGISGIVVGKILSMEKHPDADKLRVSKVDIGDRVLQIVTGAQNVNEGDYIPLAVVGANLPNGKIKKGKLRGVESEGMMCSVEELGLSTEEVQDAPENGVYIFSGEPQLGSDAKQYFGLNDTVIEFEITSNRPDCFSILGLARETAVTFKKPFNKPVINVKEEADNAADYIAVEIQNPELCSRYAARVVKDVKIEPSPAWMRNHLRAAGVRPINNLVDITNYVMLELGQPMHAFDLDKISGGKIIVRAAKCDEKLMTLDDKERSLDTEMLVIADTDKPVAVAGVMGGANSEVSEETNTILLESANFVGGSVRKTAQKLGMRSEASSRFEKGLDVNNVINAIDRAAQLIEALGAGKVCKGIVDCYPVEYKPLTLELRQDKINAFLGTSISTEDMVKTFEALEFGIEKEKEIIKLIVPSFRPDVEREADLAEEVARFYDYNNIKPTLLSGKEATQGKKSYKQIIEDIINDTMVACGLYEIFTYSFTSPKVFDKLNLESDNTLRNTIVIKNPLGEDYSVMRTTTVPEMLGVLSRNYNHKNPDASLYEMGKIYLPDETSKDGLPDEREMLTIGMYGSVDFYQIKGVVEQLLHNLGIKEYEFIPKTNSNVYHPGRTAVIRINGKEAGIVGEIRPDICENFECPERTYLAEIRVAELIEGSELKREYKRLPKFPAMTRDIAMLIKDEILVKQIEEVINTRGGSILEDVKLFDVYKGKQVPDGMKSVAYSLTFRAEDRTLVDDEVNKAMNKILSTLKEELDAQLRE